MPSRIEDYALIGDCETAALVSREGSIDWLCWPRFDSHACFAALLGTEKHGRWLITATDALQITRDYRNHTLVLETRFETPSGAATLIDFMPPRGKLSDVVRLVRGDRGRVRFTMELTLRFDYGSIVPWVTTMDDGTWSAIAGPDMVLLRTPVNLQGRDFTTVAAFDVAEGEMVPFAMTYGPSHLPAAAAIDPVAALENTETFWRQWAERATCDGPWADAVMRSAMLLKALTYAPTGGVVAAPTTSLPEQLGGTRNWDYRYCWLRDATLTLLALMNAGYQAEAKAWRDWLLRAAAGSASQIQIMYGLAGERRLSEFEIGWLPGYEGSKPVRVGNAAHHQLQLDVYGEVMDALHQSRRGGIGGDEAGWAFQRELMAQLEHMWQQPDHGMWEVRGGPQHFTYSKVMCWVAFDRAVKSVEEFGLDGPVDEWRATQHRIHADVCAHGFNQKLGSFVQAYGSDLLDASLLLLPTTGFLPPSDPRILGTVEAIARDLMCDGLIARYDTSAAEDGLPPGEGTFLACSFWLADAYVLLGRVDEARALFERLLALRNDVGLLAEEYDSTARRQVGNFPQAFSHVALVNTAHNLARAEKPARQRAGNTSSRTDRPGRHRRTHK
jgi:GH15 family glucan-1,4-alpha-glucosidase